MPETRTLVVTLVMVAATLLLGLTVVAATYDAAPGQDGSLTANATVDYANDTTLSASEEDVTSWSESITANDSGGTILADGTDYEWHPGNATIDWLNTTETTGGESVAITANYTSPPDTAENMITTIGPSFELGAIIPLAVAAVAILGLLALFRPDVASRGFRR